MAPRQFPGVRIPIPVVILLCLCVVGGVWWAGTRKRDFLALPSENRLSLIREKAGDAEPSTDHQSDLIVDSGTAETINPQPQVDSPQLADYHNQAVKDPASLAELARELETQGKPQRSLLAWERVLDSAEPDEARTTEAIQAIKRLRPALPEWNMDSDKAIAITLHAGTGKSTAEILIPVLEEIARDLEQASSGILMITASVATGHDIPKNRGPVPIALWFAGPGADASSTEVRAFTIGPAEILRDDVLKNLLKIIRNHLARAASLTMPEAGIAGENPLESMHTRITRLGWLKLGASLNKSLE